MINYSLLTTDPNITFPVRQSCKVLFGILYFLAVHQTDIPPNTASYVLSNLCFFKAYTVRGAQM